MPPEPFHADGRLVEEMAVGAAVVVVGVGTEDAAPGDEVPQSESQVVLLRVRRRSCATKVGEPQVSPAPEDRCEDLDGVQVASAAAVQAGVEDRRRGRSRGVRKGQAQGNDHPEDRGPLAHSCPPDNSQCSFQGRFFSDRLTRIL